MLIVQWATLSLYA